MASAVAQLAESGIGGETIKPGEILRMIRPPSCSSFTPRLVWDTARKPSFITFYKQYEQPLCQLLKKS
jgi:hypothetical protein